MKTIPILLLALTLLSSSLSAQQSGNVDQCNDILVPQIDWTKLTQHDFLSYVSQINETHWNQKKSDGGFVASLTKYFPISVEASWSNFKESRDTYFKSINYQRSSDTFFGSMRSYLTDGQVKEWGICMQKITHGLFIYERQMTPTHVTLSILWIAPPAIPPAVPQPVPVESALVGGKAIGRDIPEGALFKDGFTLAPQQEVSVLISRDPFMPISAKVDAGGFSRTYSYGSTFTQRIDNLEKQVSLLRDEMARFHAEYLQVLGSPPEKMELTTTTSGGYPKDGAVTLTCPPGTYMYGITFGINEGNKHGIVNSVTPLYKPFRPQPDKKQP